MVLISRIHLQPKLMRDVECRRTSVMMIILIKTQLRRETFHLTTFSLLQKNMESIKLKDFVLNFLHRAKISTFFSFLLNGKWKDFSIKFISVHHKLLTLCEKYNFFIPFSSRARGKFLIFFSKTHFSYLKVSLFWYCRAFYTPKLEICFLIYDGEAVKVNKYFKQGKIKFGVGAEKGKKKSANKTNRNVSLSLDNLQNYFGIRTWMNNKFFEFAKRNYEFLLSASCFQGR